MPKEFIDAINRAQHNNHEAMKLKGFWDDEASYRPIGLVAKLGLITAEVAEVMEVARLKEVPASDKIPEFTAEEEECADVFLRLLDYCGARGIRLAEATLAKSEFNRTRAHKHNREA